jgi:glycine cleavage system H lipoate-binding protein
MVPTGEQKDEQTSWKKHFTEMPVSDKYCRHVFGGYVKDRVCTNYFNCSECVIHKNVVRFEELRYINGWREKPQEEELFGLRVPATSLYHRGHTTITKEAGGTYTVGLDDFGTRLIGTTESVVLPEIGTRIVANEPAWRVTRNNIDVALPAPVTGIVVETGTPETGWYLRIKPEMNGDGTKHLLQGPEVKNWIMNEIDRLQVALAEDGFGVSFSDGGVLLTDLPAAYAGADWKKVYRMIFLQP